MEVRYYDVKRHWTKRIEPHLNDPIVKQTLMRDFGRFTRGRWGKKFRADQVPHDFESCDWWLDHRGRMPRFWRYVKHAACHWLVNFNLELANRAEPKRPWRVITSDEHPTVFDGESTLFDMNFLALGVPAAECLVMACSPFFNGKELPVGKHLHCRLADHWMADARKEKTGRS
jgi:hypothetical protein